MAKKPGEKSEVRLKTSLLMSKEFRELSSSAKVLYLHLVTHHSYVCKSDTSRPLGQSDRQLEYLTGMTDRTITKAKRELVTGGWVEIRRGKLREASQYYILKAYVSAELRTRKPADVSALLRVQKDGQYVVSSKCNSSEKKPDPDSPKAMASDICRMLAEDPEEVNANVIWWENLNK